MKAALIIFVATTTLFVTKPADAWASDVFGPDKALHFGVSFSLAAAGHVFSTALVERETSRALIGAAFAIVVGGGKELFDLAGFGDASGWDFAFDVLGAVTGAFFAYAIDLIISRTRTLTRARSAAFAPS